MIFVLFTIAAIVTIITAVKLSTYADVISEKSSWGGLMVGTILLAGATSLPEVTTSLTAVFLDNPDIAVGNMLGSNMFNLLIIATFDLVYRKEKLFSRTDFSHVYTASLGIFLSGMALFSLFIKTELSIFGIGIDALLILGLYAAGMYFINRKSEGIIPGDEEENTELTASISLRRAKIGFFIAAAVILASGSLLTITGDQIALQTGLGSSFVGSFLIAASTSLPEAISVLIALQLQNHNLALGSILGSNLFNMILLAISDIFYFQGPIIAASEPVHIITATTVCVLSAIVLFSVVRGRKTTSFRLYSWPSFVLVLLYFVSSFLIFQA